MTSMVQPQALRKIDGDYDEYLSDSSRSDETEVEDAMVIAIPEVEDAMVVEIPVVHIRYINYVDLLDLVDLRSVECLNESGIHCISNVLEKGYRELEGLNLESIVDGQLLIYIPFKHAIKLHSLVIQAPVYNQEGPKTVKLFSNKEHFGFSDASEVPRGGTVILSEENLKGKPVILKQVRFQNIHGVTY